MENKMILAFCAWNFETGYAAHAKNFFTRLNRRVPVRIMTGGGDPSILTDEERSLLNTPIVGDRINIILETTSHPMFYQNFVGPKIAFNVWESTKYPDDFFRQLLMFDQLWVVSKWARYCAIEQGYPEDRVFVVREGVDGDYFKPNEWSNNGRFQFLHFGRWDYRKSTEELIKAFIEEFDGENVELVLSVDSSFPIDGEVLRTEERLTKKNLLHPQLKIVHFLPRKDYLSYLQTGNCLVTCARAEGWNLPLIEAEACGIPTICSDYGAQLEFAEGIAHKVRIKGMVPTKNILYQPDGIGEWAEPDFDHLKQVMRDVYDNYEVYKVKAVSQAVYVRTEFSWEKAVDQAVQILHDSEETFLAKPKIDKPKDDRITITFNDKAKVEIQGESSATYRVVFIDQDTSLVVHEGNITPVVSQTVWISPNRRFFTNWFRKNSYNIAFSYYFIQKFYTIFYFEIVENYPIFIIQPILF
jgi:glycosyltransferase involved in cell wall biosynthesis